MGVASLVDPALRRVYMRVASLVDPARQDAVPEVS